MKIKKAFTCLVALLSICPLTPASAESGASAQCSSEALTNYQVNLSVADTAKKNGNKGNKGNKGNGGKGGKGGTTKNQATNIYTIDFYCSSTTNECFADGGFTAGKGVCTKGRTINIYFNGALAYSTTVDSQFNFTFSPFPGDGIYKFEIAGLKSGKTNCKSTSKSTPYPS